jgi:nicotinamidase-related amidase
MLKEVAMKFDPAKTAVLSLDVQEGILSMVSGAREVLAQAEGVVEAARKNDFTLIHVGLGFEPGYPEVSPKHARFSMLKEKGLFLKGSDTSKFHSSVFKAGDTVVYKHRVSAFSGNSLQMILSSKGIENLVLFGFATSGIVLSTLRAASDLDYKCIVIKDACMDTDLEVHRVLTEKVFANQATVMTTEEFKKLYS